MCPRRFSSTRSGFGYKVFTLAGLVMTPTLFTMTPTLLRAETAIESVTVTATPFATDADQQSVQINIIEGRDKRRRQSLSLGELLQSEVGVASIATGTQASKPVLRGFTGDRLRVLSGGVAQEYQQFGVRHLANVDPYIVERVEVIRGPMSVLYGSGALGGVVNMVPRTIPAAPNDITPTSGRVTAGYQDAHNGRMLGLEAEGGIGNWGWTTALSSNQADQLATPDDATFAETGQAGDPKFTGDLPNTDYQVLDGAVGIGYVGDFGRVSLRANRWDNEQNFLLTDGSPVGQNLENTNLALTANIVTMADWQIKPQLNWQENIRQAGVGIDYDDLNSETTTLDIRLDRYTFKLGVEHPEIAGWKGEWGIESVYTEQDLRKGKLLPDTNYRNRALYGFEQKTFGAVTVQAGLRYDHISQRPASDSNLTVNEPERRSWSASTASLGANWALTDHWQLIGNIARGFRAPSMFELYANGVHGGVAAIQRGDPGLSAETTLNTDLGLRWRTQKLEASLTAFSNQVDNYIYLSNTGLTGGPKNLPIYQAAQGDAELTGVELGANWHLTRNLQVNANYAALEGELEASGSELPLLPADRLDANLVWTAGDVFGLASARAQLGFSHVWAKDAAGRYEPFAQFDNNSFGTASTDSYNVWQLGLGADWALATEHNLEVDLTVSNLLDESYRDFLDTYKGYSLGPGRNIQLRISVPFG